MVRSKRDPSCPWWGGSHRHRERQETGYHIREPTQGKQVPHNIWLQKQEGPSFMRCYDWWDLKPGMVNIRGLYSGKAGVDYRKQSHCPQSQDNVLSTEIHLEAPVCKLPRAYRRDTYLLIWVCPKDTGFVCRVTPLGIKELAGAISLPCLSA